MDNKEKGFENIAVKSKLEGRHSSVFLPPISKGAIESMKKKDAEFIKVEEGLRRRSETGRYNIASQQKSIESSGNKSARPQRHNSKERVYISAFDGAHTSLPKYSEVYENVKNLAPVLDCLKGQA